MNELSAVVVSMPLDGLVLETELQPRAVLDRTTWEEYLFLLGDGTELPPVIAFGDGGPNWLVDGYHRWHAHKAFGATTINVHLMSGNRDDALRYSLRANATHGKRREPTDYARSYEIAVKHAFVADHDTAAVCEALQCSMRCAYDLTERARKRVEAERDARIAAKKAEGKSTRAVAREMDLPQRTVQDIVERNSQPARSAHPPAEIPGQAFYDEATSPAGERWWGALRALQKIGEQASVHEMMEEPYDGIPISVFNPALVQAHTWINELYRRYLDE